MFRSCRFAAGRSGHGFADGALEQGPDAREDECGCQVLYSFLQSSMSIRASVRDPNSVMFNSSSRTRPLNDSTHGFCHGEPGSM